MQHNNMNNIILFSLTARVRLSTDPTSWMRCKVVYCTGESSAYDLAILQLDTPVQGALHQWEVTAPQQGEENSCLITMITCGFFPGSFLFETSKTGFKEELAL